MRLVNQRQGLVEFIKGKRGTGTAVAVALVVPLACAAAQADPGNGNGRGGSSPGAQAAPAKSTTRSSHPRSQRHPVHAHASSSGGVRRASSGSGGSHTSTAEGGGQQRPLARASTTSTSSDTSGSTTDRTRRTRTGEHTTAVHRAERQARQRPARRARSALSSFFPTAGFATPIGSVLPALARLASLGGSTLGGGGSGSPGPSGSAATAGVGALVSGLGGSTPIGIAGTGGATSRSGSPGPSGAATPPAAPAARRQAPLTRVINAVPAEIWFALAGLLALAVALAGAAILTTTRWRRREGTIREMEGLATTDSLTGVLNRGAFEERLRAELARARRYDRPLGLLTFDVEGLKAVNDAHGHRAGDDVLRAVAGVIAQTIRDEDLCGRMGGDEYAVLVTEQGRNGTEKVMRRIASQMPECRSHLGLRTDWDLSAGIASFPRDGRTARELLDAADRRLYLSRGIHIQPAS